MKDRELTCTSGANLQSVEKESYLTIDQIAKKNKKDWSWVVRQIAPYKDQLHLENYKGLVTDIEVPMDVFMHIPFAREAVPAEEWLTSKEIINELGVDYRWVYRRLLFISSPVEYRTYRTMNRVGLHFSLEALAELQSIRDKSAASLDPENYFNINQISTITRRHPLWVTNRLDRLDVEAIIGIDSVGKSTGYYPRSVLETLKEEASKHEEAKDDLTIPMLSRSVGKDREWVIMQLDDLDIVGDYKRFSDSGRVDLCYPPQVLTVLRQRAEPYLIPEEGWYTKNTLVEITGKSLNWVNRRINKLGIKPVLKQDIKGVLRYHYPPETLDALEGWDISGAISYRGEQRFTGDQVAKFRSIYQRVRFTINPNTLKKLGVKSEELAEWLELGLVTKWANNQISFTKKAERVIAHITQAEEAIKILEGLRDWLE